MKILRLETDIRKYAPGSQLWRGHITVHLNHDIIGEAIIIPGLKTKKEARWNLRRTLRLIRISEWSDIIDDLEKEY